MTSQCLRKYLAVATTVVGIVAGFLSLKVTAAASDSVITGIADITNFMETCPTNDSAYAQIRDAIEILVDGRPIVAPVSCTEPFSSVPIAQLSDELILLQALRTAYYMSSGTERRLPWTTLSLWDWMTLRIDGVNIRTVPGQSFYCCDQINGRYYIAVSRNDPTRLAQFRTWPTLSVVLTLLAHETRHADPGAPGHTTGCLNFPSPTDAPGCDATYDPANLGAYGIQYWLYSAWATGFLNVGMACSDPAVAAAYLDQLEFYAFYTRDRFVTNAPPALNATPPYGGPCVGGGKRLGVTDLGDGLVSASPGILCGPDCSEYYAEGANVRLFATPDAGSVFQGWGGACNGTGVCNLVMSVATNVTATFTFVGAGSANANEWVQRAYVAYYGRPADPSGLAYWAGRMDQESGSLSSIIGAFGNSDEFNRRYGGLTYSQLIDTLYQQTLGRAPDAAGKDWYMSQLATGRTTLQTITLDLLGGATGTDALTVANRLDVANHYTGKVAAGCAYGDELTGVGSLGAVTFDTATTWAAKMAIEGRCGP